MLRGLYTSYTGMLNEQYRMDIMSNSLANVNTVGFKKEGSTSQAYADVMAVKIKDWTETPNTPKKLGNMSLGVKIGETYTDFSQGSFRTTENTYDLAIGGKGFFNIEFTNKAGETSTKYTRDGGFTITKDGYLVTKMATMFSARMAESSSLQRRAPQCLTAPAIFIRMTGL